MSSYLLYLFIFSVFIFASSPCCMNVSILRTSLLLLCPSPCLSILFRVHVFLRVRVRISLAAVAVSMCLCAFRLYVCLSVCPSILPFSFCFSSLLFRSFSLPHTLQTAEETSTLPSHIDHASEHLKSSRCDIQVGVRARLQKQQGRRWPWRRLQLRLWSAPRR